MVTTYAQIRLRILAALVVLLKCGGIMAGLTAITAINL